MLAKLSLRARLILGVIALAGVGFVAADLATYTELRSFLFSRTDNTLEAAHMTIDGALGGPGGDHQAQGDLSHLASLVPGVYVQVRSTSGTVLSSDQSHGPGEPDATPSLPARITYTGIDHGRQVAYFTVAATAGGDRFRVRASNEGSYVLLVASSLHDVTTTLDRLLLIEAIVTLLVLLATGALGLWVIRLSLRPLTAIGSTAAMIAAGDLSQRVAREDTSTEVGRLGLALNSMLAQIETAFRAREASERKLRRFVADASHELRTPLAAVRAYAELFTRGAAQRPDDLERSMSGITRESERMSLLVEDLLLLARLDEGRPLESDPVDLRAVVAEAVETAQMVEPDRPISCTLDEATVQGDHHRLRQIVDNLLANVRSHTPAGAPATVTLRRDGGDAVVTVEDTGPGIDGDQAEHLFERFYRTDDSRTRASGGVGLGLSIVAAVTAAHGGRSFAEPGDDGGARFVIRLPLTAHSPRSPSAFSAGG